MTAFATDQDLLRVEPSIKYFVPETQSDFMPQHLSVGDEIVDELKKHNVIELESDLMDTTELNVAAKYKALSVIFGFMSPNADDKFQQKSDMYLAKYENEMTKLRQSISVDLNQDGTLSDSEKKVNRSSRLRRQ
jgi:hypothetical protein